MNLLNKLFGYFTQTKDKIKVVDISSPIDGEIISLEEIPDEAFAAGVIGDGVGIIPDENSSIIYAPCNSELSSIFDTLHAISIEVQELELIIHFGIDTVNLRGKGFTKLKDGEKIKKGEKLIKYDLNYIKANAKSICTPVVIANMEKVDRIEKKSGKVKAGDLLMRVYLK